VAAASSLFLSDKSVARSETNNLPRNLNSKKKAPGHPMRVQARLPGGTASEPPQGIPVFPSIQRLTAI